MNNQIFILLFLIFCTVTTLWLYMLKSSKNISYKNDERWAFIRNKASNTANYFDYIFLTFLAFAQTITLFYDFQTTLTLSRVFTYATLFFGLKNSIELFALKYYDKHF